MIQGKLASIIIPMLNEAEHVEKLLDSILEQTYRPLELLLVDGGSNDGSTEIAQKYSTRFIDSSIDMQIFDETKFSGFLGPAHARNVGILNSLGECLLFMDADFLLSDDSIVKKVMAALEVNSAVAVEIKPLIDNFVEEQVAMDDYNTKYHKTIHYYFALQKSALEGQLFDEPRVWRRLRLL